MIDLRRRPQLAYAWLKELPPPDAGVLAASRNSAMSETRAVLLFANAQLLDLLTTILGLRSGLLSEANPIAGNLFDRSMQWTLTLKLLIGFAVLLLVYRFVSRRNRTRTLRVMAGIALVAALANAVQLLLAS
jgi:uncharacterized BrkB/YihY/UPF0761 family membrane protein